MSFLSGKLGDTLKSLRDRESARNGEGAAENIHLLTVDGGGVSAEKDAVTAAKETLAGKKSNTEPTPSGVTLDSPVVRSILTTWREYSSARRLESNNLNAHRKGPAPIEEAGLKKAVNKSTYGTLDSDVEDLDFEEFRGNAAKQSTKKNRSSSSSLAACKALIIYFSKLAKSRDDDEKIDLGFVESLLKNGADINFIDRHGQTVLHEIARAWHTDVAKFALKHGANVNKADNYGRTPLHLAAAVNYSDMVEFLINNGAEIHLVTFGECQTPMHYAAKNDAVNSMKALIRLGANINDRDYKGRTPLFVSAEAVKYVARSESARFLVEKGAPVGVYDDSGTPTLSLMIEKMPNVAKDAIEQFHEVDLAFRKHRFFLNYLEPDRSVINKNPPTLDTASAMKQPNNVPEVPISTLPEKKGKKEKKEKKERSFAKMPLAVIVQYKQLDLIMHPVFKQLLEVKWGLFGQRGSLLLVMVNLIYTLIWTVLGITIHRRQPGEPGSLEYRSVSESWWRVMLELSGCCLTAFFILMEVRGLRESERMHSSWKAWRIRQVERDIQYCHPRWPEERNYLQSELNQIRSFKRTYFRDPWNIFEWLTYFVILTFIITKPLATWSNNDIAERVYARLYSIGLVILWLRLMRSCRAFTSLGPFIAILGHVVGDTLKFAFLYFEFFFPYAVGFWVMFGGAENAKIMGQGHESWENFHDLLYNIWMITMGGDYDFEGLAIIDRVMAQVLVGSYIAISTVVCLNLYIALLSDTFGRVYAQATANAVMQQALLVLSIESSLSKKKKLKVIQYMQDQCSPLETYHCGSDINPNSNHDQFDSMTRHITNRIDELQDAIKGYLKGYNGGRGGGGGGGASAAAVSAGGGSGGGGGGPGGGPGGGGGGGGSSRASVANPLSNALAAPHMHKQSCRHEEVLMKIEQQTSVLIDIRKEIADLRVMMETLPRHKEPEVFRTVSPSPSVRQSVMIPQSQAQMVSQAPLPPSLDQIHSNHPTPPPQSLGASGSMPYQPYPTYPYYPPAQNQQSMPTQQTIAEMSPYSQHQTNPQGMNQGPYASEMPPYPPYGHNPQGRAMGSPANEGRNQPHRGSNVSLASAQYPPGLSTQYPPQRSQYHTLPARYHLHGAENYSEPEYGESHQGNYDHNRGMFSDAEPSYGQSSRNRRARKKRDNLGSWENIQPQTPRM